MNAETDESPVKCEPLEEASTEGTNEPGLGDSCTVSCEQCGQVYSETSNGQPHVVGACTHPRVRVSHPERQAQKAKQGSSECKTQKKSEPKPNVVVPEDPDESDETNKQVTALDKNLCFCPICATQFASRDNFEQHQPCERNIVCVKCDKRFKCPYELKRHLSRKIACKKSPETFARRKLKLECDVCGQQLQGRGALANHKRIHIGERQFKCMECERTFVQAASLQAHITRVHEQIKPFLCYRCGKSYCLQSGLDYHLRSHYEEDSQDKYQGLVSETLGKQVNSSGKIEFRCSICDEVFEDASQWLNDLRDHLKQDDDISTSLKSRILSILKSQEEGLGIKKFQCQSCESMFLTKKQLRTHMKDHIYKCQYCNRKYAAQRSLTLHLQGHTKKYRHCCEKCGEGFATREKLRYHLFSIHDTVTPSQHWCVPCQTAFRSKGMLQTHNRKTHGEQKEFICQVCLKTFATKYGCEVHIRIHADLKPFHCPKCPRSFADFSNLIHHGAKVHPAEPKALFYRREGFTTEKMNQEGANTVLSIDSSQLEILHELNNLDSEVPVTMATVDQTSDQNTTTLSSMISVESTSAPLAQSQYSDITEPGSLELGGDSMLGPIGGAGYLQFDQLSPLCCPDDAQEPQDLSLGHCPDLPLSTPPIPKDRTDLTGSQSSMATNNRDMLPLDPVTMDPSSDPQSLLRISADPLGGLSINTGDPQYLIDADSIRSENMATGDTRDPDGQRLLQVSRYDVQQNLGNPLSVQDHCTLCSSGITSGAHIKQETFAQAGDMIWDCVGQDVLMEPALMIEVDEEDYSSCGCSLADGANGNMPLNDEICAICFPMPATG